MPRQSYTLVVLYVGNINQHPAYKVKSTMTETPKDLVAIDNFSTTREYPHSPTSISPVSSRRDSLRQHSDRSSDPPTPNSSPMRLTRKRAASLSTESANDPRIEDLGLNSAKFAGPQAAAREQVCLCQPDPKIPRPRNGIFPFSFLMSCVSNMYRCFHMSLFSARSL